MREITESNYQEVAETDGMALVQFSAAWCAPCKLLSPRLQELEDEGVIAYYKVDIDQNPELAREFRIMSIPTLFLYRNGQHVKTIVGAKSKPDLKKEIDNFVKISEW